MPLLLLLLPPPPLLLLLPPPPLLLLLPPPPLLLLLRERRKTAGWCTLADASGVHACNVSQLPNFLLRPTAPTLAQPQRHIK